MRKLTFVLVGFAVLSLRTASQQVVDYDGNVYDTVYIGNLAWFKKNLRVTHYSNGIPIPHVTDTSAWALLTTGARCYYANDSSANDTVYGALYNWFAVNSANKICPDGWRVPTDAEWLATEASLGGQYVAGGKMKEAGTLHWASPNVGATNSSGFTGLPGGMRDPGNNNFRSLHENGLWWTSTPSGSAAWSTYLWYMNTGVDHNPVPKQFGFSIRCVRDIGVGTGNKYDHGKVRIYPNPTADKVEIGWEGNREMNLEIFNSNGKLVFRCDLYDHSMVISTRSWSEGIYLVRISCPEWSVQKKLIKE